MSPRDLGLLFVAVGALTLSSRPARAQTHSSTAAPDIDVYTFGPGDHLFSKFGHSAICATPPGGAPRCYNYGTADFSTPVPLTYNFLRGKALFWVSVARLEPMLAFYRREDRSIYRQRLPLSEAHRRKLALALEASTAKSERYYRYHHFKDNCTTRIRDLIDRVMGGDLARATKNQSYGETYRELAREGFKTNVPLLLADELVLGRAADKVVSDWEASFLPMVLMNELKQQYGAEPVKLYKRKAPVERGFPRGGQLALVLWGVLTGWLILLSKGHRGVLSAVLGVNGLVGFVLWALAALSDFPELSRNEILLLFVPFDPALVFLGPKLGLRYLRLRLSVLGGALVFVVLGLFVQPLWAPAAAAGLPLISVLALRLRARSAESRP